MSLWERLHGKNISNDPIRKPEAYGHGELLELCDPMYKNLKTGTWRLKAGYLHSTFARRAHVVDLQDHLDQLCCETDLLLLRQQDFNDVLLLHVCTATAQVVNTRQSKLRHACPWTRNRSHSTSQTKLHLTWWIERQSVTKSSYRTTPCQQKVHKTCPLHSVKVADLGAKFSKAHLFLLHTLPRNADKRSVQRRKGTEGFFGHS